MIEISLPGKTSTDTMDIVQQLRNLGLSQGVDFDFSYHHQELSWYGMGDTFVTPRYAKFKFYNEREATMFTLRYV